ncbi:MAG: phytanoyl-CoA dioxygenase family protein [Acidisphaera sp.]|nr:phytanoyl-CoA dioxygenase family protein [Acidisphaera sp.]
MSLIADGLAENPAVLRGDFERDGYAVVRGAVPATLCAAATAAFDREVRPDRGYFMRHQSGELERHVFTEHGFMKYPIMNVQDLSEARFRGFRTAALAALTHEGVQRAVAAILGEPAKLIHTMYFDGNQTTWAHRDGSYIDAQSGGMIGLWLALEDIHAGAGRFFVVRRSHRHEVMGEQGADPNGPEYKALMAKFVAEGPLEVVAPALRQGDLILWTSRTIHGSLPTTEPGYSRKSFTGHYVGASRDYGWQVETSSSERTMLVNGMPVVLHGQRNARNMIHARFTRPLRAALRTRAPWLRRLRHSLK